MVLEVKPPAANLTTWVLGAILSLALTIGGGYVSSVRNDMHRLEDREDATAQRVAGLEGELRAIRQQLDRIESGLGKLQPGH